MPDSSPLEQPAAPGNASFSDFDGVDANTLASFIAEDLWDNHSEFRDNAWHRHELTPDSKCDATISINVDGDWFHITVTKQGANQ